MGCCGGHRPNKKYTLKEYVISATAITVFILFIYIIVLKLR